MNIYNKNILTKRFLYTCCFIALMIIDWTRGSQTGAIWAWTINMTGVVMAVILFSSFQLKEFLKPVYIIYSTIGLFALVVAHHWWMLHQTVIFRDQLLTALLNIWLLGIFVIKMFLDVVVYKTKKLHFCKTEMLAVVMLLWMLFSVNEDIWPGWYLIMFGLFYHTEYTKEEIEALKQGMLDGIIAGFFLLQGAAFIFRPYDIARYAGIYNNCNINALFYGIVWIALLIRLYDFRKMKEKRWKNVLCFLFMGIVTAFSLMTGCRTAWLAMFVSGFFYVIFADFHSLKYKAGQFLEKLALYVAVVCISIPVTFAAVRYLPPVFHHPVWYDGEYDINRVHSWDSWDSEKYISWEEFSNEITSRIIPLFKMIFGKEQAGVMIVQASSPAVNNLSYEITSDVTSEEYKNYSSIWSRLLFWEYYLKNGTIKGHSSTEGHDIWSIDYVWHTQNIFVQFWYYYGIPSAILLFMYLISLVFISMKKMLEGNNDALICLLYLVFWGVYGLTEAVWYPGQMILFLAFFIPKFLVQKEDEREKIS